MRRIILVSGSFIKENIDKDVKINAALFKLGIFPLATVEVEYGNFVLEGSYATLAHHVSGWSHNPPPCIAEVDPIPETLSGDIIISHLDLDAIGGCLALCGMKPQDDSFWEAAAFIDINGVHHLPKLPQKIQDQLNAFYTWKQNQAWPYFLEITDVTMLVRNASAILREIFQYNPNLDDPDSKSQKLIQRGRDWYFTNCHNCFARNAKTFFWYRNSSI